MQDCKKKRYISTGTSNLSQARQVLKKIQAIESLHKSQNQLFSNLFKNGFGDQVMSLEMDGVLEINPAMTLTTAVDRFITSRGQQIAPATTKSYRLGLANMLNALKPTLLIKSLNHEHYDQLLAYLLGRFSKSTTNIRLRSVRTFLNWLVANRYLKVMPFKIKMMKVEQLPKFLTPLEIQAVLSFVDDPLLLSAYKIYEGTGMRLSELPKSQLEGEGFLRILGKGSKTRIIPIAKELIEDYQLAVSADFSTDYLSKQFTQFWRRSLVSQNPKYNKGKDIHKIRGNQLKEITFRILERQHAKRLGKTQLTQSEIRESHSTGHSLHSLRHSFALRKWVECKDLYMVRKLLGHSSITVTEHYAKFPTDYLKEVFQP